MTAPTEDVRPQDLARIAMRAAIAAGRDHAGEAPATRARRASAARGDDRDPKPLGGLLEQLLTDRGWAAPVAGGSLADLWPRACPEYADTVTAGHYDPATGRLDLHPAGHAHATQLRLMERSLVERLNTATGTTDTGPVRALRILPPGTTATTGTHPASRPADRTPTVPAARREPAPATPWSQTPRQNGHAGPTRPAGPNPGPWARAVARARQERAQAREGERAP